MQDNESFVGPSQVPSKEGIRNCDWTALEGGDGFYVVFDPADRDVFYAESQEGFIHRINLRTGEKRDLRPEAAEGQERYRFHWNAPLIGSHHQAGVLYLAGNRVFRLTDKAEHYKVISPDLTRNEPGKIAAAGSGAENYGVIYSLAESPVKAGLLWAGTDDGRLWVTQNDGGNWTELTAKLPEPERGQWIVRIEPGAKDAKVAYVVTNAYRSGDDRPFILRTADLGQTWQSVVGQGLPPNDPVEVVREDPVNSNLLYAGTHFGLFASFDAGAHWLRVGDLPNVRVDDLQIHPRTRRSRHRDPRPEHRDSGRHAALPRADAGGDGETRPSFHDRASPRILFALWFRGLERERRLSRRESAGGRLAHLLGKRVHRR